MRILACSLLLLASTVAFSVASSVASATPFQQMFLDRVAWRFAFVSHDGSHLKVYLGHGRVLHQTLVTNVESQDPETTMILGTGERMTLRQTETGLVMWTQTAATLNLLHTEFHLDRRPEFPRDNQKGYVRTRGFRESDRWVRVGLTPKQFAEFHLVDEPLREVDYAYVETCERLVKGDGE